VVSRKPLKVRESQECLFTPTAPIPPYCTLTAGGLRHGLLPRNLEHVQLSVVGPCKSSEKAHDANSLISSQLENSLCTCDVRSTVKNSYLWNVLPPDDALRTECPRFLEKMSDITGSANVRDIAIWLESRRDRTSELPKAFAETIVALRTGYGGATWLSRLRMYVDTGCKGAERVARAA
jgi:hypothetical protein